MAAVPNVPLKLVFYRANSQILELDGLKDSAGNYLNSATVTATLIDKQGNQVPSFVNITLTYVTASQGIYQGSVASTFNPDVGGGYRAILDASQGAAVGHWVMVVEVDDRRV